MNAENTQKKQGQKITAKTIMKAGAENKRRKQRQKTNRKNN